MEFKVGVVAGEDGGLPRLSIELDGKVVATFAPDRGGSRRVLEAHGHHSRGASYGNGLGGAAAGGECGSRVEEKKSRLVFDRPILSESILVAPGAHLVAER